MKPYCLFFLMLFAACASAKRNDAAGKPVSGAEDPVPNQVFFEDEETLVAHAEGTSLDKDKTQEQREAIALVNARMAAREKMQNFCFPPTLLTIMGCCSTVGEPLSMRKKLRGSVKVVSKVCMPHSQLPEAVVCNIKARYQEKGLKAKCEQAQQEAAPPGGTRAHPARPAMSDM